MRRWLFGFSIKNMIRFLVHQAFRIRVTTVCYCWCFENDHTRTPILICCCVGRLPGQEYVAMEVWCKGRIPILFFFRSPAKPYGRHNVELFFSWAFRLYHKYFRHCKNKPGRERVAGAAAVLHWVNFCQKGRQKEAKTNREGKEGAWKEGACPRGEQSPLSMQAWTVDNCN